MPRPRAELTVRDDLHASAEDMADGARTLHALVDAVVHLRWRAGSRYRGRRRSGARIDEVALNLFVGPGLIIDVRGKPARTAITEADVAPHLDAVAPGTIVLLHTGWPRHYGTPAYADHPFLGADACAALLERGARTFCLDTQNIDETPDDRHPGIGFPVHLLIADAGGIVVENLAGLEQIEWDDPLISVLPLRLTGADGSPTRAVAIEIER